MAFYGRRLLAKSLRSFGDEVSVPNEQIKRTMFNPENDFSLPTLSYYYGNDSFQHISQNCPRHVILPW